jgi:hypothetical protein
MAQSAQRPICGTDAQLDHYILYHNHFELGKLYARRGDTANAQKQFDHVMNGTSLFYTSARHALILSTFLWLVW